MAYPGKSPPHNFQWLSVGILLLAAFLRGWQLMDIPPGLTHDEAGHGHDAAGVLVGVRPIYFPVGYGREPLYDYLNAGLMSVLGPADFALRYSAFAWGMLAMAVTFAAARRLFGVRVALWAAALMAVSFWPLATGRQALRSAMLPVFTGLAVLSCVWRAEAGWRRLAWGALGLGLSVAAGLYTYIPARVLWLMFPVVLLVARPPRRVVLAMVAGLLLAGILAFPLFNYLRLNPATEARLDMLDAPLDALLAGDPGPVWENVQGTALAFAWPGYGDSFLAYNIPGRPIFDPLTVLLSLGGLMWLLVRWRKPASILALCWLGLGLAASVITGPAALFTRAIGAQPVIYMLPGLGLVWLLDNLPTDRRRHNTASGLALAGLALVAAQTSRDYFAVWGQSPDVRAAYQSTLVAMLDWLDGRGAVVSTVYPGVAHDPYIAEMVHPNSSLLHWTDARFALILPPEDEVLLLVSTATPLHPAFGVDTAFAETIQLRQTDLDPAFEVIFLDAAALADKLSAEVGPSEASAIFDEALELVGGRWLAETITPGGVAELLTVWRVLDPAVGPSVPPANRSDIVLFSHVLRDDGSILVQRDELYAPSWQWQTGDVVVQVHQFWIGEDTPTGTYRTVVGVYDRASGARGRLPGGEDVVSVVPLVVGDS